MSSREQANGSEVEFGGKGPPSGSPKIGRTDRGLDGAEVRRKAQETRVASAVEAGKGEREATEGRSVGADTLCCNREELETGIRHRGDQSDLGSFRLPSAGEAGPCKVDSRGTAFQPQRQRSRATSI